MKFNVLKSTLFNNRMFPHSPCLQLPCQGASSAFWGLYLIKALSRAPTPNVRHRRPASPALTCFTWPQPVARVQEVSPNPSARWQQPPRSEATTESPASRQRALRQHETLCDSWEASSAGEGGDGYTVHSGERPVR